MQVIVKETTYGSEGVVPSFCCKEMEEAWAEQFVGFGKIDSHFAENREVNIYTCAPYPEGAVWEEMAIRFCPFCAEPITVV